MSERIRQDPARIAVLVAEPGQPLRMERILATAAVLREMVGGDLTESYPFPEPVAIVYHDSSEAKPLPKNLLLRNGAGEPYAIVHGPCLAVGVRDGAYVSLNAEQIRRLWELFRRDRLDG